MMANNTMENYQGIGNYFGNAAIENKINSLMKYNPLEMQLNQLQPLAEPEDPPETLYTPWGVWLHWRDPLHKIDQKFDAAHVVRTGMAAEDILHYAHYVPVIGDKEHARGKEDVHEAYGMGIEYDYTHDSELYNSGINVGKEIEEPGGVEITDVADAANEDEALDADVEIGLDEINTVEDKKELGIHDNKQAETNLNPKLEAQLTRIFEKI